MPDGSGDEYAFMDRPEILAGLFHPRPEYGSAGKPVNAINVLIPVEGGAVVGGRFHVADPSGPNLLFFHGNGEIAADYDDLAPLYAGMGMNFLAVDYRGYGRSTGRPSAAAMMKDCHIVFEFAAAWRRDNGHAGPLIAMGRSLGSASALELASCCKNRLDGLIIESGFAHTGPLLELLGANVSVMGFTEEKGFRNLEKMRTWDKPVLIIHAEFDHIIPFSDGQALYDACPSSDKTLLKIPGANHNDVFLKGLEPYLKAVKTLCEKAGKDFSRRP